MHLWVYLPWLPGRGGFGLSPVLAYACDGQNLFKPGAFSGDLELDELLEETHFALKLLPPLIVVGMDDGDDGSLPRQFVHSRRRSDRVRNRPVAKPGVRALSAGTPAHVTRPFT